MGSPEFAVGLVEVWIAQGQFCETKPLNLWSLTITLGRVRTELNCCTPSYGQRIGELLWENDTYLVSEKKRHHSHHSLEVSSCLLYREPVCHHSYQPVSSANPTARSRCQLLLTLHYFFFPMMESRGGEKLAYPCVLVFFIYLFSYVFSALFYAPKK